ncbi:MAG: serine hydrolase [Owenweeksia sp.]|nr:serine hydrolase [Owenweeksia sp.]
MKNTLLSALLVLSCMLSGQESFQPKLDSFLTYMEKNDRAMGSVALRKGDQLIYQKSIGMAQVKDAQKATAETLYRIGSISKTFTATIIFQLVEEGQLTLGTPLGNFFPELPTADSITVEQMLRHRSGLANFTSDPGYTSYMTQPKTRKELLSIVKAGGTDFEPDEKMAYSNTNYVLLSFIIEEVEKKALETVFKERIVQPLKLSHTYLGTSKNGRPQEAHSYEYLGGWEEMPVSHLSIPLGAGAVISNPADLTLFYRALFEGQLVSPASLAQMTTKEMGMFRIPFDDKSAYGHNGGIDGFKSNAAYFPAEDLAVAFTTNGMNFSINELMIAVLSIYFQKEYAFPEFEETKKLDSKTLEQYTGTYATPELPIKVTITHKNGFLVGQGSGQPPFQLKPEGEHRFSFAQAGLALEFMPEENKMILKQGGTEYVMERE